jgi:hypothetical protein
MKKLIRKKLRVNGETIRTLATPELTHVVGGWDSGKDQCAALAVADSAPAACPKPAG